MIRQNAKRRAGRSSRRVMPRPALYALVLGLGIGLGMVWMLEGTGVSHYWRMTRALDKTKADIVELEQANAALRRDIRLADSDPLTLEQSARALGYVKAGETIYQFMESP